MLWPIIIIDFIIHLSESTFYNGKYPTVYPYSLTAPFMKIKRETLFILHWSSHRSFSFIILSYSRTIGKGALQLTICSFIVFCLFSFFGYSAIPPTLHHPLTLSSEFSQSPRSLSVLLYVCHSTSLNLSDLHLSYLS